LAVAVFVNVPVLLALLPTEKIPPSSTYDSQKLSFEPSPDPVTVKVAPAGTTDGEIEHIGLTFGRVTDDRQPKSSVQAPAEPEP
jgi:hypothetical protein